ncbi:glycosyltransferase family 4 protein [Consotaella salsifontis]|uniref:Glycosyltransferase involved in cell wall bisynthesis n=1 Tax=Consotaella salsifontis TaxID=1365950 RepID=A0A1T4P751_9HYPH|nr:glycosyltransferase family 1 protein [Consotaella salsifontis]SJZ87167.1 Glycosyltransferase involved in cell wall bisynthesis [Consotaella salsifontis]
MSSLRILIATDAWFPQINGVVRTLSNLSNELQNRGAEVEMVTPSDFATVPCPSYPEIRLALARPARIAERMARFDPHVVHIATEGPIGLAARRAALKSGRAFTTSFHTRFPEYLRRRAPIPESATYAYLRWFHRPAAACLVPSSGMVTLLENKGFNRLVTWPRGFDRAVFHPRDGIDLGLPRPIFLTVSRLAPEKNIGAFLDLDLPGSKVVVGDGPSAAALRQRYPDAHFLGAKTGEELGRVYCGADVFVFPSKTDTFGIVLIEALACGLPIAAYREPGPLDVVGEGAAGCLSDDLTEACAAALSVDRAAALRRADDFSWKACADVFLSTVEARLPGVASEAASLS